MTDNGLIYRIVNMKKYRSRTLFKDVLRKCFIEAYCFYEENIVELVHDAKYSPIWQNSGWGLFGNCS